MDYTKRYSGTFLRIDDCPVTVELWVADELNDSGEVGELSFPADSPVTIERSYQGKEEPVEGATLTVTVLSPGDRTYTGLYSIDPGMVRMDIFVDGNLYWRGLMDAETYSEPYERARDYEVSLQGTDFGILDRRRWEYGGGFMSVMDVVRRVLGVCALDDLPVDTGMISTTMSDGSALNLEDIVVNCENFINDEGEGLKLKEVLKGALQPLGLHIRQCYGKVYIYDINGFRKGAPREIYWTADRQDLGVDRVYNTCRITFSPGMRSGNLFGADDDFDAPPTWFIRNIENQLNVPQIEPYSASADGREWLWWTIFGTNNGSKCDQYDNSGAAIMVRGGRDDDPVEVAAELGVRPLRIKSLNSGEDCAGIAVTWPSMVYTGMTGGGNPYYWHCNVRRWGVPVSSLLVPRSIAGAWTNAARRNELHRLMKTRAVSVGPTDAAYLKITMEMLFDGRLNPWEAVENNDTYNLWEWNSRKAKERIDKYAWMIRVPIRLLFRSHADGRIWMWQHFNQEAFKTQPVDTFGRWIEIADGGSATIRDDSWSYLSYWENDREGQPAAGGWKTNRPHIFPGKYDIYETLKRAEGQYVYNPARDIMSTGDMWLEVFDGDWIVGDDLERQPAIQHTWRYFSMSPLWVLFKLPKIEPVAGCFPEVEVNEEDIITEGVINKGAAEDIEISTICGTATGLYGARGIYIHQGRALETLCREGYTAGAEELLIRTLLSNYGHRHTVLSGEMRIPDFFGPMSEACQSPDARFIIGDSAEDVRMWTTDASVVEVSPDNYEQRKAADEPGVGVPPWSDVEQDKE